MLIVDDALLFRVLASTAPAAVVDDLEAGQLFTTGCWYYRLSRAIHDRRSSGALTRAFARLDERQQRTVLTALDDLPPSIGLITFRRLVPIMVRIDIGRPLNMLAAEAVAAALLLSGGIAVSTDGPPLRAASHQLGVDYQVIAVL